MDINPDYPNILYGDLPMFARLLTAIHIACIDAGGEFFGVEYGDDDLQKFFDVSGHCYFAVEPTGGIEKAASTLKNAVLASVEKGELKLAVVRRSLAGDLSLLDSWIGAGDFEEWCNSRGISLGESWFELWKDDQEIFSSAAGTQDLKRRQYEGLYDSSDIQSLRDQLEKDGLDHLLEEVAALRSELERCKARDVKRVEEPVGPRSKTTYLNIIAAMLELIQMPRDGRTSDSAVIAELLDNYKDKPGISKATLENKFAEAKRSIRGT
ncbi:hypothetical protein HS961_17400 [Comamonas piscis]|uniref:Uncharacterized protein n=1 Tax=Comamonas piscis TaxID=1562974 RepID=A0A7G5EKE1_9BURK|nr:hypothetical protein [Comamonas piscis]QMV74466.1 hypothetical protein HS961_17400 [Comamonas piscis]WSO32920.1 hypothetical protein VUJ63_17455 [Comamonas piscis]